MNNWQERLREKLAKFNVSVDELFKEPFNWKEIMTFLKVAIEVAEEMFPESGKGEDKLKLVMEIWDFYDKEYKLVKKIDDLVDFEKVLGKLAGTIVESIDHKAIRYLIENLLIPQLVGVLFPWH